MPQNSATPAPATPPAGQTLASPAPTSSIIARVVLAIINAIKAVLAKIFSVKVFSALWSLTSWTADKALLLTGIKHTWSAVVVAARNPEVMIVAGLLAVGAYLVGHYEEELVSAQSLASANMTLSRCRTDLGLAKTALSTEAAKCRHAAVPVAPVVAVPPAVVPGTTVTVLPLVGTPQKAADAVSPPAAPKVHRKKKAAAASSWSFFK